MGVLLAKLGFLEKGGEACAALPPQLAQVLQSTRPEDLQRREDTAALVGRMGAALVASSGHTPGPEPDAAGPSQPPHEGWEGLSPAVHRLSSGPSPTLAGFVHPYLALILQRPPTLSVLDPRAELQVQAPPGLMQDPLEASPPWAGASVEAGAGAGASSISTPQLQAVPARSPAAKGKAAAAALRAAAAAAAAAFGQGKQPRGSSPRAATSNEAAAAAAGPPLLMLTSSSAAATTPADATVTATAGLNVPKGADEAEQALVPLPQISPSAKASASSSRGEREAGSSRGEREVGRSRSSVNYSLLAGKKDKLGSGSGPKKKKPGSKAGGSASASALQRLAASQPKDKLLLPVKEEAQGGYTAVAAAVAACCAAGAGGGGRGGCNGSVRVVVVSNVRVCWLAARDIRTRSHTLP